MKTRLRPKHRRVLLAALPPLAADLGDGRLVALAAEVLRERAADLSLGEFALEEAQANTRVAAALLRGFEAAVGEPFPCEPTEISAALDRLRGRLAASDEVRRRAQQAGELERAVAEALGVAPPSVEKDPIAYLVRAVRTCRDERDALREDAAEGGGLREEVERLRSALEIWKDDARRRRELAHKADD